jgi:hypothetical protein
MTNEQNYLDLKLEDQEEGVTVSAIIRSSPGRVAFCLLSPAGGECEIFIRPMDAKRLAEALQAAVVSAETKAT